MLGLENARAQVADDSIQLEPGGWRSLVRQAPEEDRRRTGWELLSQAATSWSGNVRYARTASGLVIRGEVPSHGAGAGRETAAARLAQWFSGASAAVETPPIDDEDLETALAELGWPLKRRDDGWVISPGVQRPFEIAVRCEIGGVRGSVVLDECEGIEDAQRRALAAYVLSANAMLRFVRVESGERGELLATCWADSRALGRELSRAIEAVVDATRRLLPQIRMLAASQALAEQYLAVVERSTE